MALLELETGRITCEVCGQTIGQGSSTAEHGGAVGFLEGNHLAPCGLPCANEAADLVWLSENAKPGRLMDGTITGVHTAENYCPRCEEKPCPACNGRGVVLMPARGYHSRAFRDCCDRCRGTGRVPGRETWEEI